LIDFDSEASDKKDDFSHLDKPILRRTYNLSWNCQSFQVTEKEEKEKTSQFIKRWTPKEKMISNKEMNFFNDNVDYNCSSFEDIQRLNCEMLDVAEKHGWLAPSKSPPVLKDFLKNFENLQTMLKTLESSFQKNESKKEKLEKELKYINPKIQKVVERMMTFNGTTTNPVIFCKK